MPYLVGLYHEQGLIDKAKKILNKTIKKDETNSYAWYMLGTTFFIEKNYSRATDSFKQVIMVNSFGENKNASSFMQLGNCKLILGNSNEAMDYYKKSIQLHSYPGYFFEDLKNNLKLLESHGISKEKQQIIIKELEEYFSSRKKKDLSVT